MRMWRRGMEVQRRGRPARLSALCAAFLALGALAPAQAGAVLDLKRGDVAPAFTVASSAGEAVSLENLRGRIVVMQFAEVGHERSRQATKSIARAIDQDALMNHQIAWVTLYTKSSDPAGIEQETMGNHRISAVVHDVEREVFGIYQVVVLPSTVVIDAEGKVVHASAGLGHPTARFGQTISDALLLASGNMTPEQFEQTLNGPEARDEELRRAERLTQMARRLSERGEYAMAESHFLDALDHAPDLVPARLGLADLLIRKERLDEAQSHLRRVLDLHPRSLEAGAALALVLAIRGGEELPAAESMAREVLERSPRQPRAYYVLGLVHEKRGEESQAAACYRRAFELVADRPSTQDESASVGNLP